jgi:ABC-type transport system substrate-binding protein
VGHRYGWIRVLDDGGFDPRNEMIGHGPYMLAEAVPSVSYTMRRNPHYYDEDAALIDEIELPIVSEYAARLAQLKAGNLWQYNVLAQDIVAAKNEESRLNLYANVPATNNPAAMM